MFIKDFDEARFVLFSTDEAILVGIDFFEHTIHFVDIALRHGLALFLRGLDCLGAVHHTVFVKVHLIVLFKCPLQEFSSCLSQRIIRVFGLFGWGLIRVFGLFGWGLIRVFGLFGWGLIRVFGLFGWGLTLRFCFFDRCKLHLTVLFWKCHSNLCTLLINLGLRVLGWRLKVYLYCLWRVNHLLLLLNFDLRSYLWLDLRGFNNWLGSGFFNDHFSDLRNFLLLNLRSLSFWLFNLDWMFNR